MLRRDGKPYLRNVNFVTIFMNIFWATTNSEILEMGTQVFVGFLYLATFSLYVSGTWSHEVIKYFLPKILIKLSFQTKNEN
jgi:hypothetical protein